MRVRPAVTVLLLAAVAACSETVEGPAEPVKSSAPAIEAITTEPIEATTDVDWVLVAFDKAWVSGLGDGVGVFDARTGAARKSVKVPQRACSAMAEGFGAVWTATCGTAGVARIDPASGQVTGHVAAAKTSDEESSVGAGEGAIWVIVDRDDCTACAVTRIDPEALKVTARFPIPPDASAVRAGLGGVWVTYPGSDTVVRLDPADGRTVASVDLPGRPSFLAIGDEAVWVMAQSAGSLCRIDPQTNSSAGCTKIDPGGTDGGDVTTGDGYVWYRGTSALVTQVDTAGRIVRRIGTGAGSGSASAGSGHLWISAHDAARLYRVPVRPPG
jgi:virginiamycin B lyase